MTEFRAAVSRRFKGLVVACVLFVLTVIATALYNYEAQSNAVEFVHGLQVGIFIGTLLLIVKSILRLRTAMKNETSLKMLYIEERDERKQLVQQKANSLSLNALLLILSLAAIVTGFFHATISITLFAVLALISMTSVVTRFYYNRKY